MKSKNTTPTIATNKKAFHDYFIEKKFEAGLALQGWEVKSIRANRVQLKESYVVLKNHEAWLIGAHFSPLLSSSTHIKPDPTRSRKLLLHKKELDKLMMAKNKQGYTIVALNIHWRKNCAKLEIAIAKGKKLYDKRDSDKQKTWDREKHRLLKNKVK